MNILVSLKGNMIRAELAALLKESDAALTLLSERSVLRQVIQATADCAGHIMENCFSEEDDSNAVLLYNDDERQAAGMFGEYYSNSLEPTAIFKNAKVRRASTPGRYVIIAGSRISRRQSSSCPRSTVHKLEELIADRHVTAVSETEYVLVHNVEVNSLSAAASLISGNSMSGLNTRLVSIKW